METEPKKAIKRLAEFDLLKFIHPALTITRSLETTFGSIQETLSWFKLLFFDEELNRAHLFLMALFDELNPDQRQEALQRLYVPPSAREEIITGIEKAKHALIALHRTGRSEIYHSLNTLNIQTILFTMVISKDKEQKKSVSLYLTTLRAIRPELTGKDLQSMGYLPGPVFKRILKAILEAKLEEKVQGKDKEVEFVRENFPLN
jgi:tRNA nucleotidyltransferase (CCA-adding enzyme)